MSKPMGSVFSVNAMAYMREIYKSFSEIKIQIAKKGIAITQT